MTERARLGVHFWLAVLDAVAIVATAMWATQKWGKGAGMLAGLACVFVNVGARWFIARLHKGTTRPLGE